MAKEIYHGACHCGQVTFEFHGIPEQLVDCNCSLCSKTAALWAHSECENIRVNYAKEDTIAYVWGDKALSTHSCSNCGCTTHWEPIQPADFNRMAVNFNLCSAEDRKGLRIRKLDGADTWEYLD